MASWQMYINNLESSKARCSYAAIFGRQGGKWAESQNKASLPCTDEEIMVGVRALVNQDGTIMSTGIKVGGFKFACIVLDSDVLVCQGKEEGRKDMSLVFTLTEQAVIVGFNAEAEVKSQIVRDIVEKMKDFLKKEGL